jgi:hypothetical protein
VIVVGAVRVAVIRGAALLLGVTVATSTTKQAVRNKRFRLIGFFLEITHRKAAGVSFFLRPLLSQGLT